MTVLLAFAIWVGVSAIFAPLIGHFLFTVQSAYSVAQPVRLGLAPRPTAGRSFDRRRSVHNSWSRKPVAQTKFG
jgi:hypothetical protein